MQINGPANVLTSPLNVSGLATEAVGTALRMAERCADHLGAPAALTSDTRWIADSFASGQLLRIDGTQAGSGFAPLSGFFTAAGGFVRTHANYPHHRAALLDALEIPHTPHAAADDDSEHLRERVVAAFGNVPAQAVAARIRAAGGICMAVQDPQTWLSSAQAGSPAGIAGREVALRAIPASWRAGRRERVAKRQCVSGLPLAGLRIVSLTRVIAGPIAARFLAARGLRSSALIRRSTRSLRRRTWTRTLESWCTQSICALLQVTVHCTGFLPVPMLCSPARSRGAWSDSV